MQVRIQKYLSEQGILSRREAEKFLTQGLILINGKVVRQLGTKIDPQKDKVQISGTGEKMRGLKKTVAYYKPRGIVSSRNSLEGETIFELLPQFKDLNIVGRLDKESEGLILLTDDGVLSRLLTGKEHLVPKVYEVTVQENLEPLHVRLMTRGVKLEDGFEPILKIPSSRVARDFPVSARRNKEGVASATPTKLQRSGTGKSPQPEGIQPILGDRGVTPPRSTTTGTSLSSLLAPPKDWPVSQPKVFSRWVLAKADKAEIIGTHNFRLTLREGRKHQIRRMCDAVRITPVKLKRVKIGLLDLRGLSPGGFRELSSKEVASLKSFLK